jgi:hypothetical protein
MAYRWPSAGRETHGKDGTHPSRADKIARELLRFFKTDSTARLWFTARR